VFIDALSSFFFSFAVIVLGGITVRTVTAEETQTSPTGGRNNTNNKHQPSGGVCVREQLLS